MVTRFTGVQAVVFALFDEGEQLDRVAMAAQMAYIRQSGADGVVVLGLATEVAKLSMAEKCQIIDWAAEDRGDLPLGVTITGNSVAEQRALADHAAGAGADWLILQPPLCGSYGAAEYIDFFARVGSGTDLPFAIQNAPQYLGRSLSGDDLAALAARCPGLTHLKAETTAADLAGLIAGAGPGLTVLNGRGGLEMTDCLRSGCAGFIVAPDVLPGVVACMAAWEGGDGAGVDRAKAEAAYAAFLPAATFGMQSLEHLACYGKRIFALRAGLPVHDRAPALRPSAAGLAAVRHWADLPA